MCACGASSTMEINLIPDQQKAVGGRKPKSAVKSSVKVKGENDLLGQTAAGVVYSCSHAHATAVETFQISISAFVLRFLNLNVHDNLFSISLFASRKRYSILTRNSRQLTPALVSVDLTNTDCRFFS